jgi:hypothetical protein
MDPPAISANLETTGVAMVAEAFISRKPQSPMSDRNHVAKISQFADSLYFPWGNGDPLRSADMQYRTETTLEELLAEPIVLTLMESDGVSMEDARKLYAKVRTRSGRRGKRAGSRLPDQASFRPCLQPSGTHMPCCM